MTKRVTINSFTSKVDASTPATTMKTALTKVVINTSMTCKRNAVVTFMLRSRGLYFESEQDNGKLAEVIGAAQKSRSFLAWNSTFTDPMDLEYLNDKTEVWSRAYAQWVSLKGGDALMKSQADRIIEAEYGYWEWDDFVEIEQAISTAFNLMGWL